jgi:alpha-tubulin suppressor-like RCC1 family protein
MIGWAGPPHVLMAALILGFGGSAAANGPSANFAGNGPSVSWVDAAHKQGWIISRRCTPRPRRWLHSQTLCATDDGGRHWRPIFSTAAAGGAEYESEWIASALRWSARAGIVSVTSEQPLATPAGDYHQEWWTRDGGRHWYRTSVLSAVSNPSQPPGQIGIRFSRGRIHGRAALYATAAAGSFRIAGWPPEGATRCSGHWQGYPYGYWPTYPYNICAGNPVDAGMAIAFPTPSGAPPDGSGTLTIPPRWLAKGSSGNTVVATYVLPLGKMKAGAVTLTVPAGWSAPSTDAGAPGYATSSTGTVSTSGQTIVVSGLALSGGAELTITYGSKTAGGPGATAPDRTGTESWNAQEKSTASGTLTDLASSPQLNVLKPAPVVSVAAGFSHTCALTSAGAVLCWGSNWYGELGDGTQLHSPMPVAVSGLVSGVDAITAGANDSCALTSMGGVKCWGINVFGQLGDTGGDATCASGDGSGPVNCRLTPIDVSGLASGGAAVAAGYVHTCALATMGAVECWGENGFGQLGDGTTTNRPTPVGVVGLSSGIVAVATGGYHSCTLTSMGGVRCWGGNAYGQLGDGTTTRRSTPVDVSGLASAVSAVAAGESHTCVLTSAGAVKCWGWNGYGQLGDGTTTNRAAPVDVLGLSSGVVAITGGRLYTCALTSAGAVECWGANSSVQLGDGTTTDRLSPVAVSGLSSGVVSIAAGSYHTCAVTSAGGVKCWGDNSYGDLGDGTTTRSLIPADVSGLPGPAGRLRR